MLVVPGLLMNADERVPEQRGDSMGSRHDYMSRVMTGTEIALLVFAHSFEHRADDLGRLSPTCYTTNRTCCHLPSVGSMT